MSTNRLIVVLGPTASGKSDLSVQIAKKIRGEIVSADSRQVYRGMDLGTGKITKKEMCGIPHHLLDVVSPNTDFSAEKYKKKALCAIREIWRRKKIPVLCGGTGFYIDTVVSGAEFPKVPPNKSLRTKLSEKSAKELFRELQKLDPLRAKSIDRENKARLIRAIEIAKALGKVPLLATSPIDAEVIYIGIKKPREELKRRIAVRLDKRIRQGMLKEMEHLHANGVSWKRMESFGLEYRWGARHLQGKISKADFRENLLRDINRYAKRQMTWFKRNRNIHWVENFKEGMRYIDFK